MSIRVLAIDPGITTGYCLAEIGNNYIQLHPYQLKHSVEEHYDELHRCTPDHIVIEDFLYRRGQRDKLILYSVQLIGVCRLFGVWTHTPVTLQTPATGKSFYSDEQLKRLGAYKRGVPHGMDATRHLFHWLTFGPGFQYVSDIDTADITVK